MNKKAVKEVCIKIIESRLDDLHASIQTVHESVMGEDKSSAGDKFETARAMAHADLARLSDQVKLLKTDLTFMLRLNPDAVSQEVTAGSIVQTSKRWIYLSVGLGKISVDAETLFAVSPSAPLAQAFLKKGKNDVVSFNGNDETILGIF